MLWRLRRVVVCWSIFAAMPTKRCYFHPDCRSTLFSLPRDGEVRDQWLKFIFNSVPQNYYPNLALCAAHFTEESFHNLREFNAGFAQRLVLKDGAVPTLKTEAVYGQQAVSMTYFSSMCFTVLVCIGCIANCTLYQGSEQITTLFGSAYQFVKCLFILNVMRQTP